MTDTDRDQTVEATRLQQKLRQFSRPICVCSAVT